MFFTIRLLLLCRWWKYAQNSAYCFPSLAALLRPVWCQFTNLVTSCFGWFAVRRIQRASLSFDPKMLLLTVRFLACAHLLRFCAQIVHFFLQKITPFLQTPFIHYWIFVEVVTFN